MACGFKPTERISFVTPNPKKPGSQAHARYGTYCKAKTVAEALHLGASSHDLAYDKGKGFLKRKGGASAKDKQTKRKAQTNRAEPNKSKTSAASGLALSYIRDVPLLLPGDEEGQRMWGEMKDAGWRRCEFKFLAGVRKGLPYTRFVQPPAEKETSRRQVPTGKSINGGFPTALKLYAKRDAKMKARVEALLERRTKMQKLPKNNLIQRSKDREECIKAYRAKYGKLGRAAELFAKHPGWQENATTFVSPDGEKFAKSMSANNLRVLLPDMEAHIGKELLKTSRSKPKSSKKGLSHPASHVEAKAKRKVETKSKADSTTKNLPQIKALTLRLIKTVLGSGAKRCSKNKDTFSKDLNALIDKYY